MNKTDPAIMKRTELANAVLTQTKEDETTDLNNYTPSLRNSKHVLYAAAVTNAYSNSMTRL